MDPTGPPASIRGKWSRIRMPELWIVENIFHAECKGEGGVFGIFRGAKIKSIFVWRGAYFSSDTLPGLPVHRQVFRQPLDEIRIIFSSNAGPCYRIPWRLRYSRGDCPVWRLKKRENWNGSWMPTSAAIALTGNRVVRRRWAACSARCTATHRAGVSPCQRRKRR